MKQTIKYQWSQHRTREAAQESMEQDFAEGLIDLSDCPTIVKNSNGRYAVMLNDNLMAEYTR